MGMPIGILGKTRLVLSFLMAAAVFNSRLSGQEKPAADAKIAKEDSPFERAIPMVQLAPAMRPATKNGPWIALSDLVLAKIDIGNEKGGQLVALVEHMYMEEKEVQFTKLLAEKRTRKVSITGPDGKEKQVDQEYTVSVPVTEKKKIQIPVPSGKTRPMSFPVTRIKFYHLDGSPMEAADATRKLQKVGPVFLIRDRQVEIKKIDELYQRSLNPECVIAVVAAEDAAPKPMPE
jgi:hypothetical protein